MYVCILNNGKLKLVNCFVWVGKAVFLLSITHNFSVSV